MCGLVRAYYTFDSGGKIRITVIKEKFNFYDFEQVVEMFRAFARS